MSNNSWFHFTQGTDGMECDGQSLSELAETYGTPLYVYSQAALTEAYTAYTSAWGELDNLICYAVKANTNVPLIRHFAALGAGADIASGGELYCALQGGIPGTKIIYSGVAKSAREIDEAINANILMFNIESEGELERIRERARAMGKTAGIAFRINPDIDAKTHPYITTGMKNNKFGIEVEKAIELYERAKDYGPEIKIIGIQAHIGSQITQLQPFMDALDKYLAIKERLAAKDISITLLSVGGGLGIQYDDEEVPQPGEYVRAIKEKLGATDLTISIEPGRSLVGNAGILISRVEYIKEHSDNSFVMVDAGMNDLMRPALYQASHKIMAVAPRAGQPKVVDVVGPVCETADTFARQCALQPIEPGDLLAFMSAGAYGFAMSSNYNSRLRPAEVWVTPNGVEVIRRREKYEDLIDKMS